MISDFIIRRYSLGTYLETPLFIHGLTLVFFAFLFLLHALTIGLVSALFLLWTLLNVFFCVTIHEYGHIYAARRFGNYAESVTLLPIGGVAALQLPSQDPQEEVIVALAGPVVNLLCAALMLPFVFLFAETSFHQIVITFFAINLILGVFNLIPAYPMDGGRVYFGIRWYYSGHQKAKDGAIRLSRIVAPVFLVAGFIFGNIMLPLIAIFIWIYCNKAAEGGVM